MRLPCQYCGNQLPTNWMWWVCNKCGFRVCPQCLSSHQGHYSNAEFKCSQCAFGQMEEKG